MGYSSPQNCFLLLWICWAIYLWALYSSPLLKICQISNFTKYGCVVSHLNWIVKLINKKYIPNCVSNQLYRSRWAKKFWGITVPHDSENQPKNPIWTSCRGYPQIISLAAGRSLVPTELHSIALVYSLKMLTFRNFCKPSLCVLMVPYPDTCILTEGSRTSLPDLSQFSLNTNWLVQYVDIRSFILTLHSQGTLFRHMAVQCLVSGRLRPWCQVWIWDCTWWLMGHRDYLLQQHRGRLNSSPWTSSWEKNLGKAYILETFSLFHCILNWGWHVTR